MDFVLDNLIWLIAAAAGLVQWWKGTQEAKAERRREAEDFAPADTGEMIGQAGRNHPRSAVPPPLPQESPPPPPTLRRRAPEPPPFVVDPYNLVSGELERQAQLAEQMSLLKKSRRQRSLEETPTVTSRRRKSVEPTGTLRGRLRNHRELKQAFVMKEILEKPVGLR